MAGAGSISQDHDDIAIADLKLGALLDKGGQGEVWALTDRPTEVFKKYLRPSVNGDALATLVAFPQQLSETERRQLYERTAWPLARVCDAGLPVGFVMRRAPADFIANPDQPGRPQLRELQYLLYQPSPLWGDIRPLEANRRVSLARDFVELLRLLHRYDVVVGDISMRNILWSDVPTPRAFLLDCDSVTIKQSPTVLPVTDTIDWKDPHQPSGPARLDTDRYKLALFVGRVLAGDAYAQPGKELNLIPGIEALTGDAVRTCFDRAAGLAGTRPEADEWARALSGRASIPLTPPVPRPAPPRLPVAPADRRGERDVIVMRPLARPPRSP
jgi:hypothetical protein